MIFSIVSFSRVGLGLTQDPCAQGGKSYKIALIGHSFGESEMETLIKGQYTNTNCKAYFSEVIRIPAFKSTSDYFKISTFRTGLLSKINQVVKDPSFDAVLLNLDLTAIEAAMDGNPKLIGRYKSVLVKGARLLNRAAHIKAVLIPAGNHGNYSNKLRRWMPENLATSFISTAFFAKKLMLVAAANSNGTLAADTGYIDCRVLKKRFQARCKARMIVRGEIAENRYETYLAASVVMNQLIQKDFNLSSVKRNYLFRFDQ